ncbi:hypothetical protein B9479_003796 [Cryptococcus floricola]|uniref:JmjC domain-containing protein n=1 Tax=Cryptococcus floricola TaxID=2591691 RepID=A0A5D3AYD2_9TREE|nr:hypothetical protein B9479_003796 [Cryptococcus floricola]
MSFSDNGLDPLPTEFDPDRVPAPPASPPPSPAPRPQEDAPVIPSDEEMEVPEEEEGGKYAAEEDEGEDEGEGGMELMGYLQDLIDDGEEEQPEQAGPPAEREAASSSSPLSDLPDLPDEIDFPFTRRSPTPPALVSSAAPSEAIPHAESSASAARRAATPSQSETAPAASKSNDTTQSGNPSAGIKRARAQLDIIATSESVRGINRPKSNGSQSANDTGDEDRQSKKAKSDKKPRHTKKALDPTGTGLKVKGPEKVPTRAKIITEAQRKKILKGQTIEVQMSPCQRPIYAAWGKCTQCISKVSGDMCRFRDFRVFPIDPVTTAITGPGYFTDNPWPQPLTPLPTRFSSEFSPAIISATEHTVAPILLPLITSESRHIHTHPGTLYRGIDTAKHRSVCDFCSSTIFGGWWFCKSCGRDYCLECERYFPDSVEGMKESPWPLADAARPRLLKCIAQPPRATQNGKDAGKDGGKPEKKGKELAWHVRGDLQAVSRFEKDEIKEHWLSLSEYVLAGKDSDKLDLAGKLRVMGLRGDGEATGLVKEWIKKAEKAPEPEKEKGSEEDEEVRDLDDIFKEMNDDPPRQPTPPPKSPPAAKPPKYVYTETCHPASHVLDPLTSSDPTPVAHLDPPDPAGIPNLPYMYLPAPNLTDSLFDELWAKGEPIIVDGIGSRMGDWGPDRFREMFGSEKCSVVDCQSDDPQDSTIDRFFAKFGEEGEKRGKKILKLKDWPPGDEFANTHPTLYHDFSRALPAPDWTRRDGVSNLYSHFPPGPTRPDIGPKMYAAFAADEGPGGFGSTRLHMDVADAINVMLYAAPSVEEDDSEGDSPVEGAEKDQPDLPEKEKSTEKKKKGSKKGTKPGCAVWDLYPASAADKIRDFLKSKYDKTHSFIDPIHSQRFYLDSDLRKELFEKKGVSGWRVWQYPGQAVFIPAGCAHQVCNLSDSIKIAIDFVSRHNVPRCQRLTRDFRRENYMKAWKEDVLQLYNVLWFAWMSCREARVRRVQEEKDREVREREREARSRGLRDGLSSQNSRSRERPAPFSACPSSGPLSPGFAMGGMGMGIGLRGWGEDTTTAFRPNFSSVRDEPVRSVNISSVRDEPIWNGNTSSARDEPVRGAPGLGFAGESSLRGAAPVTTSEVNGKEVEVAATLASALGDKANPPASASTPNASEKTTPGKVVSHDAPGKAAKRQLAENLFNLTLNHHDPNPAEVFLASSAYIKSRKAFGLDQIGQTNVGLGKSTPVGGPAAARATRSQPNQPFTAPLNDLTRKSHIPSSSTHTPSRPKSKTPKAIRSAYDDFLAQSKNEGLGADEENLAELAGLGVWDRLRDTADRGSTPILTVNGNSESTPQTIPLDALLQNQAPSGTAETAMSGEAAETETELGLNAEHDGYGDVPDLDLGEQERIDLMAQIQSLNENGDDDDDDDIEMDGEGPY